MIVNADFSRAAIVSPHDYAWVASPQPGVDRMLLDRLGGEQGRATSIVRYAPTSHFPHHGHPGGEEILVLSGTFSEGHEHYPAGWYLRNPPGSSHRPSSREGATLFVKLRQMAPGDNRRVRVDTHDRCSWRLEEGRDICPLFRSDDETVCLLRLPTGKRLFSGPAKTMEVLVLHGQVIRGDKSHDCGTWMRLPEGEYEHIAAGMEGTTVYLRTTHTSAVAAQT
jgi:anti-sigma factor ChrR (cupin superfamily)